MQLNIKSTHTQKRMGRNCEGNRDGDGNGDDAENGDGDRDEDKDRGWR